MKTRIISGVIIAVLILGLGFPGSYPLWLMCLLCGVIGYMELTAVMCNPSSSKKKGSVRKWNSIPDLIAIPGLILTVVYYAGMMYMEWRFGLVNQQELISAFGSLCLYLSPQEILQCDRSGGCISLHACPDGLCRKDQMPAPRNFPLSADIHLCICQ